MALLAAFHKGGNKDFYHKWFFVKRTVVFIQEKDVQAFAPRARRIGERLHGDRHFGYIALRRYSDCCLLHKVCKTLVEHRTYLYQGSVSVCKTAQPCRMIALSSARSGGWLVSAHDMQAESEGLIWLHAQGRFNNGSRHDFMLLLTQNHSLELLEPGRGSFLFR